MGGMQEFVELLRSHGVESLVDVRTCPWRITNSA